MSIGPGGMPQSRHQQQFEDMITAPPGAPFHPPAFANRPASRNEGRTSTMSSFGRRASSSSNQSRGFFGWSRRSKGAGADFDEDEGLDDDFDVMSGGSQRGIPRAPSSTGNVSLEANSTMSDQISSLRDRDRYPTFNNQLPDGRSMSITSMTGGFDTTPVIPTVRGNETAANNYYRHNLTNSRKKALRTSDGVAIPPQDVPFPPPGMRRPPPPQIMQNGQYSRPRQPYRPVPNDPRIRARNNLPYDNEDGHHRGSSIGSNAGSAYDPSNSIDSISYTKPSMPPSRIPMISTATMTDEHSLDKPVSGPSVMVNTGTDARALAVHETHIVAPSESPASIKTETIGTQTLDIALHNPSPMAETQKFADQELTSMNKSLLDEVRLVTNELADSIRRELNVESLDEAAIVDDEVNDPKTRARQLVALQQELDLERRKRLLAESHLRGDKEAERSLYSGYSMIEMERKLDERERLLKNETLECKSLRENLEAANNELDRLKHEANELKNGIVPELKAHVKDLEVLTAAGNPIDLLRQIEELKVENRKVEKLVEENSTRGPMGEKIKTVESQRDALREALRSLRERKDHEIRQCTDRVRQLESKLEKERVVNHQMQRKIVQTTLRSASSPVSTYFQVSSPVNSALSLESPNGNNSLVASDLISGSSLSITKRRGLGQLPGISPPAAGFTVNDISRSMSSSPVSFEISHEPTWLEYVDPSKLPHHQRNISSQLNIRGQSYSSLG